MLVARKSALPTDPSRIIDMKLPRLFQPHNPLFWLMIAVNILSLILATIAQTRTLNDLGAFLVYGFAVANFLLGVLLAWKLASDGNEKG